MPTRAMPELPMPGGRYPMASNTPAILPLQSDVTFENDSLTSSRPAMPALPSMQSSQATIDHPHWLGNLPSIPADVEPSLAQVKLAEPIFAMPLVPTASIALAAYEPYVAPVDPVEIPSPLTQQDFSAVAVAMTPATPQPTTTPLVPFHSPLFARPEVEGSEEPLRSLPPLEREEPRVDYTDNELLDSFRPLVEQAVHRSLFLPDGGMDTYLEPMLRATIRRALAEHSPTQAPFHEPGFLATIPWRLRALFTGRTYEEIFFDKTKRFRVEEVYLLDKDHLSMISYASCDPMRHASAKRVHTTARRVADGAIDKEGTIRLFYDLPEGRSGVVREGKNSLLIAVVLGTPNDGLRIDLDYTLRRVEERFAARFKDYDAPLLLSIQPHLEDCLLIVAPSSSM